MKTIAVLVLEAIFLGCSGERSGAVAPAQKVDSGAVIELIADGSLDDSSSDALAQEDLVSPEAAATQAPDANLGDSAEQDSVDPDAWIDPVPKTQGCHVTLLAHVYEPGTDRLNAPFLDVDSSRIVVYFDGAPMSRSSWILADSGHTLVVTHDAPGGHVVSFSLDCTVP